MPFLGAESALRRVPVCRVAIFPQAFRQRACLHEPAGALGGVKRGWLSAGSALLQDSRHVLQPPG